MMINQLKCGAGLLLMLALFAAPGVRAQKGSKAATRPAARQKLAANELTGLQQRAYLVEALARIADPVLGAVSRGELKAKMPVEAAKGVSDREQYTYLEALGRLLAGMAPWLELGPDNTPEGLLREKYIRLAVAGIRHATDPASPDYMNFNKGSQPLVDAAFLAQALLRAPTQLWGRLEEKTKAHVIRELKSSRVILPSQSNWLLFSATVEAALMKFDQSGDRMRMDYAIRMHLNWYKGDGAYGDGAAFHWDYYNSYVIQPMLVDVMRTLTEAGYKDERTSTLVLKRAQRYAAVQERLIAPDGTYPPLGRSLAYRFGAFQTLAQVALLHTLPAEVTPQQVRCALYTMIKNQVEAPGTFDAGGWLRIGVWGSQPGLGERYISTGSLYLCSFAFLILGLPPEDALWSGANAPWTQQKIWSGQDLPADHAISD